MPSKSFCVNKLHQQLHQLIQMPHLLPQHQLQPQFLLLLLLLRPQQLQMLLSHHQLI
jgi:hypothetical protein